VDSSTVSVPVSEPVGVEESVVAIVVNLFS
jgi:hypothetical protein